MLLSDEIVYLPLGPVSMEMDSILRTTAYFVTKKALFKW